jgi:hypothetical protein
VIGKVGDTPLSAGLPSGLAAGERLQAMKRCFRIASMALDQATLDTDTPRTRDGRRYPDHLRAYHRYDRQLLPLVERLEPASPSELSQAIEDRRLRAVLARWMASAEWRGLIERRDGESMAARRTYVVGEHGRRRLAAQS